MAVGLNVPPANADRKIILALSGGGFRATLFHLGVIRYLRETGRLNRVTHVASVSGGSILAADVIFRWDEYTGSEKQFETAAKRQIKFVTSDVRGRIFSKVILLNGAIIFALSLLPMLLCLCGYLPGAVVPPLVAAAAWGLWYFRLLPTAATLLTAEYNKLYESKTLRALSGVTGAPRAMIASTNLSTGELVYFSNDGLHVVGKMTHYKCEHVPISVAVTASSAFPPAFAPLKLTRKYLRCDEDVMPNPIYLTDGGVFDNLGGHLLDTLNANACETIISSAEPLPASDFKSTFRLLMRRAARSTDILMQRVSSLETGNRPHATHIQLSKDVDDGPIPPGVQMMIRSIRTDLNDFSPIEVQCLYFKGYTAALHSLENIAKPKGFRMLESGVPIGADTQTSWLPFDINDPGVNESIESLQGKNRVRIGWRIWSAIAAALLLAVSPLLIIASQIERQVRLTFHSSVYNGSLRQAEIKEKNESVREYFATSTIGLKTCTDDQITAVIESEPIERSMFDFSDRAITCRIICDEPDAKILAYQPYILDDRLRAYRLDDYRSPRSAFEVRSLVDGERIFVLVTLCWPKDSSTERVKDRLEIISGW